MTGKISRGEEAENGRIGADADPMRIYLDSCALNRLTDDLSQPRIRQEAEGVGEILLKVQRGTAIWIASSALQSELIRNADPVKRRDALGLLKLAREYWIPDSFLASRAKYFAANGYGDFDALHLALAEASKADVLITTDDRFLRKSQRSIGSPTITAENPLNWVRQVKP